ncbi:MAG: phosphatase PAP2 family protein [Oscillibacter sp.]|nr:phosphatase PAP2 family protein [Oscillibacter sp.]
MQAFELAILNWIQTLRCGVLDVILPAVSWTADHGEIWILLAIVLIVIPKTRRIGFAVACGLVLDLLLCNIWLKPMIGRVRPFAIAPSTELLIKPPHDASFPSGHTAASFAAVTALAVAGSKLWRPALILAVFISFSRLYLYVHWPSDVLGGIAVGIFAGWLGAKIAERLMKHLDKKSL